MRDALAPILKQPDMEVGWRATTDVRRDMYHAGAQCVASTSQCIGALQSRDRGQRGPPMLKRRTKRTKPRPAADCKTLAACSATKHCEVHTCAGLLQLKKSNQGILAPHQEAEPRFRGRATESAAYTLLSSRPAMGLQGSTQNATSARGRGPDKCAASSW